MTSSCCIRNRGRSLSAWGRRTSTHTQSRHRTTEGCLTGVRSVPTDSFVVYLRICELCCDTLSRGKPDGIPDSLCEMVRGWIGVQEPVWSGFWTSVLLEITPPPLILGLVGERISIRNGGERPRRYGGGFQQVAPFSSRPGGQDPGSGATLPKDERVTSAQ